MKWYFLKTEDVSEKDLKMTVQAMSDERRAQVSKISNAAVRRNTVCGEFLAKKAISEYFNIRFEEIVIKKDSFGKPFVQNSGIHFNISHTSDACVCAVDENPIGVDIEKLRPVNKGIARRICSGSDLDYLSSGKGNLLEIWTAKEAYFKYKGTGITDLKSVSLQEISPMLSRPQIEGYVTAVVGDFATNG